MPGSHVIIYNPEIISPPLISDFAQNKLLPEYFVKEVIKRNCLKVFLSAYGGYPFENWKVKGNDILFEGLIYNYDLDMVKIRLKKIAELFKAGKEYKEEIASFVNTADGDFIILIIADEKVLVFNDYLGRLPLYYYCDENLCVFSREIKTILKFIPKISLDKHALVEYLMFEFPLGDKTIYKDIYKIGSSGMAEVEFTNEKIDFHKQKSTDFNFILSQPVKNKKEGLKLLSQAFDEAVKSRVEKLSNLNYHISADCSGGHDSRVILAGLSKYRKDVDYITFEYIRDESTVAKQVFEKLDAPGNYIKLNFRNEINNRYLEEQIFKTDGLSNYKTTSVCYQDTEKMIYKLGENPLARFIGFGGEFIRKPPVGFKGSIKKNIADGSFSRLTLKNACSIVGLEINEYLHNLDKYVCSYPEKQKDDLLKRWYFEFSINFVIAAGEERGRIFSWIATPMWALEFVKLYANRLPSSYLGYKYFINFMRMLDTRLLEIPIFDTNINLESKKEVWWYDLKYKYTFLNKKELKLKIVKKIIN